MNGSCNLLIYYFTALHGELLRLLTLVDARLTSGTAKRLRGETTRAEELPFYLCV